MTDGTPIQFVEETSSTNLLARSLIEEEGASPRWIVARKQTHGRGRHGRHWVQDEGNFAGSLIWPAPPLDPTAPAAPSFIAALAVRDSLLEFDLPARHVSLKWPNDVLVEGDKVAGILVERHALTHQSSDALIVGVGVNLATAPEIDDRTTACFSNYVSTRSPDLIEFACRLDHHWRDWWEKYEIDGFKGIVKAWMERAHGIDKAVCVKSGSDADLTGIFLGLDDDGAALVEASDGVQRILSGDVRFRTEN